MAIELERYKIKKSQLKNEHRERNLELETSYNYKCNVQETAPYNINCTLIVQIYDKDNHGSIEESPFFISAEFDAIFKSSSTANKEDATSETFRLLFPFVQSYIYQLTAGAFMQPLKLPYVDPSEKITEDETAVQREKTISKSRKQTRDK